MTNKTEQEYLATLEEIRATSKALRSNSRERRKISLRMEKLRAAHIVAIGSDRDEKGKLLFSNEKMREAELMLRLHDDSEYMALHEKRLELDEKGDDLVADHNHLTDLKYLHMIKLGIPIELDEGQDKFIELH